MDVLTIGFYFSMDLVACTVAVVGPVWGVKEGVYLWRCPVKKEWCPSWEPGLGSI